MAAAGGQADQVERRIFQYVVFDAQRLMGGDFNLPLEPRELDEKLWPLLQQAGIPISHDDYTVEDVPLVEFEPDEVFAGSIDPPPPTPPEVFGVSSPNEDAARRFRIAVLKLAAGDQASIQQIGIDPTIALAEFSYPEFPDATIMGTSNDARRLIRVDQLPLHMDGQGVNVVVIDSGIDRAIVPAVQFGGGWRVRHMVDGTWVERRPGRTHGVQALHGMMVVNAILAMAPKATIFDVPLIRPPKINDIRSFLRHAITYFRKIRNEVACLRNFRRFSGPWIFMNAWSIYDRASEEPFLGEYTANLGLLGVPPHPFIAQIENLSAERYDIVFCAGNCGSVCPDGRCGPNDYGPGRSVWGANAHEKVLTAGAVRMDGTWAGYSSEGPGPRPGLAEAKPDLCAPSQFVGAHGKYPPSVGTSAAAAVLAGSVAALRTVWDQATVSPDRLRDVLNTSAQPTSEDKKRVGAGILNVWATHQNLP